MYFFGELLAQTQQNTKHKTQHTKKNCENNIRFDGLCLAAPMCKIGPEQRLHPYIEQMFGWVAHWFPTLPIAPSNDWSKVLTHDTDYVEWINKNPMRYDRKHRIGTAKTMIQV